MRTNVLVSWFKSKRCLGLRITPNKSYEESGVAVSKMLPFFVDAQVCSALSERYSINDIKASSY